MSRGKITLLIDSPSALDGMEEHLGEKHVAILRDYFSRYNVAPDHSVEYVHDELGAFTIQVTGPAVTHRYSESPVYQHLSGVTATRTRVRIRPKGLDLDLGKIAPTISRPPGAGVYALLGLLLQKRQLERVFGQTVAEMREECIVALAAKKPWRYRGAWLRGHVAIAFTVFAFLGASVVKRVIEIWKVV